MKHSSYILDIYRRLMCRRAFYKFNKALYFLALKGIGIGNWETPEISGERDFLRKFTDFVKDPVVFDVGANVGNYSKLIKEFSPSATIFAFEPHPATFKALENSANRLNYTAVNLALSDTAGAATLFDYEVNENSVGTEHASLVEGVIETIHLSQSVQWEIQTTTVDEVVKENALTRIDLLKIDVEGNEIRVLRGASKSLEKELIDVIHFEFTETSMVSRIFMKDFFTLLPNYDFFRMLPDGLAPLGSYYPLLTEIFSYQNIVAIRRNTKNWM